jgi:hypothetical protein
MQMRLAEMSKGEDQKKYEAAGSGNGNHHALRLELKLG